MAILRQADFVLQEEIRRAGLYRELWQSFAVLPAVKSVGVQGDERTYAYPIVIRAVTSDDAMTADWARLPHELLEQISNRIINEVPGVNRVVLDITSEAARDDRVGVSPRALVAAVRVRGRGGWPRPPAHLDVAVGAGDGNGAVPGDSRKRASCSSWPRLRW